MGDRTRPVSSLGAVLVGCKGGEGPWEGVQHRDDDVMMKMCIEAITARVLPGLRAQGGALAEGAILR